MSTEILVSTHSLYPDLYPSQKFTSRDDFNLSRNRPKNSLLETNRGDKWSISDRELESSGFKVSIQLIRFLKDCLEGLDNDLSTQDILKGAFDKKRQDITGFILEYLLKEKGLPIPIEEGIYQGEKRVVGKNYGNKPILFATSKEERWGLSYATLEKMEQFILPSPKRSLVLFLSPKGDAGVVDKEGNRVAFPESQFFFWYRDEKGILGGFSAILDTEIDENKRVLEKFGVSFPENWDKLSDIEKIKSVSSNFLKFDGNEYGISVVDLVTKIEEEVNRRPYSERIHASVFERIRYNYHRREELLTILTNQCRDIVEEYERFVTDVSEQLIDELQNSGITFNDLESLRDKSHQEMISKLEELAEKVPTLIAIYDQMEATIIKVSLSLKGRGHKKITREEYRREEQDISSRGGCNGGGLRNSHRRVFEKAGVGKCKKCFNLKDIGPCGICEECQRQIEDDEVFLQRLFGYKFEGSRALSFN